MNISINRERLATTFTSLCEIDSPSKREGEISKWLQKTFAELGADLIYEDDSASKTGSESGNLIIRFNGNQPDIKGLFFSCHMDTVEPANNVQVIRTNDIFTSKGETILGGDDKSGIAAIIETIQLLKETGTSHPMLEIIITTCEEIGLLGAKHLEFEKIKSPYGYALDSSGINHVVIGAPAANKISVVVRGKAAHAGLCPEAGINALAIAATALSSIQMGRLDNESSSNFGLIEGGVAANIIPDKITLKGEVRSHSEEKLQQYTKEIETAFQNAVDNWQPTKENKSQRPEFEINIIADYPALSIPTDAPVLQRLQKGAATAQKDIKQIVAGGGSDANIFCGKGLQTAIIATGMNKVHTVDEQLDLRDLTSLTELLLGIVTAPA